MEIEDINLKNLIERETGNKFTRDGFILCPFHADKKPSMSVKFMPNANKQRYRCWSCGATGDVIDFIMQYKGFKYNKAREYLGLEIKKTECETFAEKIQKSIDYQLKGLKKGYKQLGIFTFVDQNNKPIYCKVKFLKPDGTKETPYYHIDLNGNVINNRGTDEVPYNYYKLLQGIAQNKTIVFVEGEKDANTVNNILDNNKYVATSIKGFRNFELIRTEMMKIAVIGDTGQAGEKYIFNIKKEFLAVSSSFKIINLPGLKAMGDNKDVTDWLEAGHTKKELMLAFRCSLDLKSKTELQQDNVGIYYLRFKKDEDADPVRVYITNFNIISACKVTNVDTKEQSIELELRNCTTGKILEKTGKSTILDDVKSFRNFLGLDYSFRGKGVNELVRLKEWIVRYFAIDNKEIYQGAKILPIADKFELIASDGTLKADNTINYVKIADNSKIAITEVAPIEKEELQELMQHLFKFVGYNNALAIIGSAIGYLEIGQAIETKNKFHHLLIVGESGTGKSTILEKIVAPLLNYPVEDKQVFSSTPFALQKAISTGNYPVLIDEFKPSKMGIYKRENLSDLFRISYDRSSINRGSKLLDIKEFCLNRPLIMAGEESFMGSEKANMTRSCIVYLSKSERTEENSNNTMWLAKHSILLRKLGISLLHAALNLSTKEYKIIREISSQQFTLKDRPKSTATDIACGIELLNRVLLKNGLQDISDYFQPIESIIRSEVLDGGEDSKSAVEQMLCLFSDILQDNIYQLAELAVKVENGQIYIRTQIMVDLLFKYKKDYNNSTDITLLTEKDFKKQAIKAGYIKKLSSRAFRIQFSEFNYKMARFDLYNVEKLEQLDVAGITGDELEEVVGNVEKTFG